MNRCSTIARRDGLRACAAAAGIALLAATAMPAAAAAKPAAEPEAKPQAGCSGEAARPARLALHMGKSTMLRLPEPVRHRSVGNPSVVQAMLVAPDTLYIAGVDVGSTNMIVQGRSGLCSIVDIAVSMDPAEVQATLAAVMPEEKDIRVMSAMDTLVLTGTVSDASAVARAVELAGAYVRRPLRQLPPAAKDNETDGVIPVAANSGGGGAAGASAGARVVNLLGVSAPQQVQLEVKVAEVSRTLIERLESGSRFTFTPGSWGAILTSNFLTGRARGGIGGSKPNGNMVAVEADKQDGLVRILAEPNVMAISGQEGSFLAGGKFYIPVAQDNNKVTLEEKEFGVGLRFTPTVLAGGRINLKVAPEVSELSREGIGINAVGIAGTAIMPLVTTRRASTTVQLYDGQSFAIGGLVKNNLVANLKGLPVLGEVPVLGALFRSTDYQQDRSELVFVITVRLVKPIAGAGYALPTDRIGLPSRGEILLGGSLEGRPPAATAAMSTPAIAPPPSQTAGGFELK
ncbi:MULTISPECIES: type II and III secretion system protein family protein [unclassified Massilia]|uniref:type II and III secretion system protein family protein n=1 Tax=unclassified Massilia TaxID=2609279 RepID=UPI001B83F814|nr:MULTISPECIES: type II and III secretion system protein family protein [unclassified Massilia]MBQ5940906.1 type II and III secretion system protein family protein [Massilia sp. AB1]MBQ5964567.1 type II and III secretion system protein family protein [Massilia sp. ZL223]